MSKKKPAVRKSSSSAKQQQAARKFYVFTALTGALTMTGALLMAISPQKLRPDTALAAVEEGVSSTVYATQAPIAQGRWKYIYVRHSRSLTPPTATTDHFILTDEGLHPTALWTGQQPASSPTGSGSIDPACVSVCVVGDFDRSLPTPTQQRRLNRLINSLQSNLRMPTRCLVMLDQPNSPAAVGKHFPTADFRGQLLQ